MMPPEFKVAEPLKVQVESEPLAMKKTSNGEQTILNS
jgi:hypothetical protein